MADNSKLASCGQDIKIWSGIDMQLLHTYNPHSSDIVTGIAWGHNSKFSYRNKLSSYAIIK